MEIFFWSGMQFQAYELYICMTGMLWLTCDHFVDKVSAMGQPTRPTQPSILPGSVNEYVIFCVVSLQVHLSFASRSIPPYIVLTISTISRGGVKINISCYMIKLDLWPWVPCRKKWFPCAQNKNSFKTVSFQFHFYLRRQFNSSSYTSALDHMYFGDPTISTATRCFSRASRSPRLICDFSRFVCIRDCSSARSPFVGRRRSALLDCQRNVAIIACKVAQKSPSLSQPKK